MNPARRDSEVAVVSKLYRFDSLGSLRLGHCQEGDKPVANDKKKSLKVIIESGMAKMKQKRLI